MEPAEYLAGRASTWDVLSLLASMRAGRRQIELRHIKHRRLGREFVEICELEETGRKYLTRIPSAHVSAIAEVLTRFAKEHR